MTIAPPPGATSDIAAADITAIGLASRLRTQTRADHERAESARFVGHLLEGRLTPAAYAALATQHLAIYTALEDWGAALPPGHPGAELAAMTPPRVPRLRADLDALVSQGVPVAAVEEATLRYAERLRRLAAEWPTAFLAHHYVRVLGDVSGGQVVRRALERHHPEAAAIATSFYDYAEAGSPKLFRDRYRALLDSAGLAAGEEQRLLDEAVLAFRLNHDVFVDLGARHHPA